MAQVSLNAFSPSFNSSSNISSNLSNNSCYKSTASGGEPGAHSVDSASNQVSNGPEVAALQKLSSNFESLLSTTDIDCSDAEIVVEDRVVPVHRCILASRSPFFREKLFSGSSQTAGGKQRYELKDWLVKGDLGYDAFMILLGYLYSGKVKAPPPGVCTCIDDTCVHDACRPAVIFAVQLMYGAHLFKIPELVSLSQRRLLNFVEKALVEDVIPIVTAANACEVGNDQLLNCCIHRMARSNLDMVALEKELPQEVVTRVLSVRHNPILGTSVTPTVDKTIRRIQRALDSDDIELVRLLLEEGEGRINLDNAYALHYAVQYCDAKITAELLELQNANVNHRNLRGYTVLHIAAMRREPRTIASLLTKGADPYAVTSDDRTALQISRRLTRAIDYYQPTVQGKESHKDRLCIEILERAEMENPLAAFVPHIHSLGGEDLKMRLLYLENRVALAKLLFPMEAKVAMEIAHVDMTSEFTGFGASSGAPGHMRTDVDLNETPTAARMSALARTVELGKRFFPRCSDVLNKFMDDEVSELTCLEKGTPEEQKVKRQRYDELKGVLSEAFSKDKADFEKSGMSSSSSSTSLRDGLRHKHVRNR
uniref:BTB domain-containing protein n=1 Tax=Araucaria cunninghamii TaxID=56994 RepID=A0A0D6QSN6_ARACU